MAHAVLSASGSSRWLACTPSARLEEKEPEKTSSFAEEGTLAHSIGELMIRYNNNEFTKRTFNTRLNKFKKQELFTNDMLDYCSSYAEIVREKYLTAKKNTPDAQLIIEQKLDFSYFVPKGFGTGDALIIADNCIEVIDFKYGKGVEVSAVENSQMKLYGLGAIAEYDMLYDILEIRLTIVQPRLENISEFSMTVKGLRAWGDSIKPIAQKAFKGEGKFCVGLHCRFCKIKAKCKAYADEQMELAKYDFKQGPFLDDGDITNILNRVSDFKKWLKAVEDFALDQAVNHGHEYPGYKLVEDRSNRKYADQDKVLKALVEYGYEESILHKPKELLGITAMQKAIGKKTFEELLSELVIKPQGKPTLVPQSDKRPSWHSEDDAKKDFEGFIDKEINNLKKDVDPMDGYVLIGDLDDDLPF
ncbi:DUF2800 domain-containing protein [Vallitalea sp.]|jgi:hypothetical protein|uniref:DUF2800 domain-containing protein n=1 Tax=Vallitalea sp. TaxID=1882829 RepID=UPI0025D12339|nr:DUF2800 domain-containing protein [Vallitalea sp.]MCT4686058.1 DUF2800 domain-containing protein [Vallitalea sp.]